MTEGGGSLHDETTDFAAGSPWQGCALHFPPVRCCIVGKHCEVKDGAASFCQHMVPFICCTYANMFRISLALNHFKSYTIKHQMFHPTLNSLLYNVLKDISK